MIFDFLKLTVQIALVIGAFIGGVYLYVLGGNYIAATYGTAGLLVYGVIAVAAIISAIVNFT